MAIFEENYRVNMSHVNANGVITNKGILTILEDVACRHSDTAEIGILDIPAKHVSWILLAWKVKIIKRILYNTNIRVCTWAKPFSKFQTCRDFEIYDEAGGIVCIATSKWTFIDTEKMSIKRIPEDVIEKYTPENKNVFGSLDIEKLTEPESFSNEYIYKTQRRDIDINKHMHNLNYLDVAYEALPEDVYFAPECNNIEIMYKKGIKLGDTIKCSYCFLDNSHYVVMKNNKTGMLNAIVKLN